ncbi:hypothetical protein TRFO_34080 [Tritrichomonas foetus]|uniref:Uncharacterized protein n=1 Tax=Tritrichomonas foetus TaxID=1144522 RepID=A0A1J4JLE3_9EUKA|nr:hypothetical protein TRFO_34080 [Tritrichomonas foetus]|eukprot:OHS99497.1 hypothetical protein TRFO_34080 [Tritrichomonas foetus]
MNPLFLPNRQKQQKAGINRVRKIIKYESKPKSNEEMGDKIPDSWYYNESGAEKVWEGLEQSKSDKDRVKEMEYEEENQKKKNPFIKIDESTHKIRKMIDSFEVSDQDFLIKLMDLLEDDSAIDNLDHQSILLEAKLKLATMIDEHIGNSDAQSRMLDQLRFWFNDVQGENQGEIDQDIAHLKDDEDIDPGNLANLINQAFEKNEFCSEQAAIIHKAIIDSFTRQLRDLKQTIEAKDKEIESLAYQIEKHQRGSRRRREMTKKITANSLDTKMTLEGAQRRIAEQEIAILNLKTALSSRKDEEDERVRVESARAEEKIHKEYEEAGAIDPTKEIDMLTKIHILNETLINLKKENSEYQSEIKNLKIEKIDTDRNYMFLERSKKMADETIANLNEKYTFMENQYQKKLADLENGNQMGAKSDAQVLADLKAEYENKIINLKEQARQQQQQALDNSEKRHRMQLNDMLKNLENSDKSAALNEFIRQREVQQKEDFDRHNQQIMEMKSLQNEKIKTISRQYEAKLQDAFKQQDMLRKQLEQDVEASLMKQKMELENNFRRNLNDIESEASQQFANMKKKLMQKIETIENMNKKLIIERNSLRDVLDDANITTDIPHAEDDFEEDEYEDESDDDGETIVDQAKLEAKIKELKDEYNAMMNQQKENFESTKRWEFEKMKQDLTRQFQIQMDEIRKNMVSDLTDIRQKMDTENVEDDLDRFIEGMIKGVKSQSSFTEDIVNREPMIRLSEANDMMKELNDQNIEIKAENDFLKTTLAKISGNKELIDEDGRDVIKVMRAAVADEAAKINDLLIENNSLKTSLDEVKNEEMILKDNNKSMIIDIDNLKKHIEDLNTIREETARKNDEELKRKDDLLLQREIDFNKKVEESDQLTNHLRSQVEHLTNELEKMQPPVNPPGEFRGELSLPSQPKIALSFSQQSIVESSSSLISQNSKVSETQTVEWKPELKMIEVKCGKCGKDLNVDSRILQVSTVQEPFVECPYCHESINVDVKELEPFPKDEFDSEQLHEIETMETQIKNEVDNLIELKKQMRTQNMDAISIHPDETNEKISTFEPIDYDEKLLSSGTETIFSKSPNRKSFALAKTRSFTPIDKSFTKEQLDEIISHEARIDAKINELVKFKVSSAKSSAKQSAKTSAQQSVKNSPRNMNERKLSSLQINDSISISPLESQKKLSAPVQSSNSFDINKLSEDKLIKLSLSHDVFAPNLVLKNVNKNSIHNSPNNEIQKTTKINGIISANQVIFHFDPKGLPNTNKDDDMKSSKSFNKPNRNRVSFQLGVVKPPRKVEKVNKPPPPEENIELASNQMKLSSTRNVKFGDHYSGTSLDGASNPFSRPLNDLLNSPEQTVARDQVKPFNPKEASALFKNNPSISPYFTQNTPLPSIHNNPNENQVQQGLPPATILQGLPNNNDPSNSQAQSGLPIPANYSEFQSGLPPNHEPVKSCFPPEDNIAQVQSGFPSNIAPVQSGFPSASPVESGFPSNIASVQSGFPPTDNIAQVQSGFPSMPIGDKSNEPQGISLMKSRLPSSNSISMQSMLQTQQQQQSKNPKNNFQVHEVQSGFPSLGKPFNDISEVQSGLPPVQTHEVQSGLPPFQTHEVQSGLPPFHSQTQEVKSDFPFSTNMDKVQVNLKKSLISHIDIMPNTMQLKILSQSMNNQSNKLQEPGEQLHGDLLREKLKEKMMQQQEEEKNKKKVFLTPEADLVSLELSDVGYFSRRASAPSSAKITKNDSKGNITPGDLSIFCPDSLGPTNMILADKLFEKRKPVGEPKAIEEYRLELEVWKNQTLQLKEQTKSLNQSYRELNSMTKELQERHNEVVNVLTSALDTAMKLARGDGDHPEALIEKMQEQSAYLTSAIREKESLHCQSQQQVILLNERTQDLLELQGDATYKEQEIDGLHNKIASLIQKVKENDFTIQNMMKMEKLYKTNENEQKVQNEFLANKLEDSQKAKFECEKQIDQLKLEIEKLQNEIALDSKVSDIDMTHLKPFVIFSSDYSRNEPGFGLEPHKNCQKLSEGRSASSSQIYESKKNINTDDPDVLTVNKLTSLPLTTVGKDKQFNILRPQVQNNDNMIYITPLIKPSASSRSGRTGRSTNRSTTSASQPIVMTSAKSVASSRSTSTTNAKGNNNSNNNNDVSQLADSLVVRNTMNEDSALTRKASMISGRVVESQRAQNLKKRLQSLEAKYVQKNQEYIAMKEELHTAQQNLFKMTNSQSKMQRDLKKLEATKEAFDKKLNSSIHMITTLSTENEALRKLLAQYKQMSQQINRDMEQAARYGESKDVSTINEMKTRALMHDLSNYGETNQRYRNLAARHAMTIARWEGRRRYLQEKERERIMSVLQAMNLADPSFRSKVPPKRVENEKSENPVETETHAESQNSAPRTNRNGIIITRYEFEKDQKRKSSLIKYDSTESNQSMPTYEQALKTANSNNQKVPKKLKIGIIANPMKV